MGLQLPHMPYCHAGTILEKPAKAPDDFAELLVCNYATGKSSASNAPENRCHRFARVSIPFTMYPYTTSIRNILHIYREPMYVCVYIYIYLFSGFRG